MVDEITPNVTLKKIEDINRSMYQIKDLVRHELISNEDYNKYVDDLKAKTKKVIQDFIIQADQ